MFLSSSNCAHWTSCCTSLNIQRQESIDKFLSIKISVSSSYVHLSGASVQPFGLPSFGFFIHNKPAGCPVSISLRTRTSIHPTTPFPPCADLYTHHTSIPTPIPPLHRASRMTHRHARPHARSRPRSTRYHPSPPLQPGSPFAICFRCSVPAYVRTYARTYARIL